MLFTCGYDPRLGEFVERLKAQVIDVRARPSGNVRKGWKSTDLARTFGDRYEWHGTTLGGRAFVAGSDEWIEAPTAVLKPLAERAKKENLILLCACWQPWECHRHNELAAPLLASTSVDALHIHGDQLIEASELQQSIASGQPYAYHDLSDWMFQRHV
jgi:hypothetical protein